MDHSIGLLLDALRDLALDQHTLVIFTSDNGPENGAGTAGPYAQRKRSLMEGGVRVPAVVQWTGTVPAGETLPLWLSTVDLLPTMLDAARLMRPGHMKVSGVRTVRGVR